MSPAFNKLFCFGYGYVAAFLAESLSNSGWKIAGTTTDLHKKALMEQAGIETHVFHEDQKLENISDILKDTTHILTSIPPSDAGDPVFNLHGKDIAQLEHLKWFGYLSTTGVYGNRDGGWVDEASMPAPTSDRGHWRFQAENNWLSLLNDHQLPVHIFRLAGIYGPGRSAIEAVQAGTARRIDKPGQVFNRIHVIDLVRTLRASIDKPHKGAIYNVADDEPAPSHALIEYACELTGEPVPPLLPFDEADMSPMARSFYADNKRIRNTKIKNELGVELACPTYREGLRACLDAQKEPPQ